MRNFQRPTQAKLDLKRVIKKLFEQVAQYLLKKFDNLPARQVNSRVADTKASFVVGLALEDLFRFPIC